MILFNRKSQAIVSGRIYLLYTAVNRRNLNSALESGVGCPATSRGVENFHLTSPVQGGWAYGSSRAWRGGPKWTGIVPNKLAVETKLSAVNQRLRQSAISCRLTAIFQYILKSQSTCPHALSFSPHSRQQQDSMTTAHSKPSGSEAFHDAASAVFQCKSDH